MHTKKFLIPPLALVLAVLFASTFGCPASNSNPPATPELPQVTVDRYCVTAAAATALAADEAIALYTNKAIDGATFTTIRNAIEAVNEALRQVTTETASTDAWPTMRVKIAGIAGKVTISTVVTDPTLKAELDSINSVLQSILGVQ